MVQTTWFRFVFERGKEREMQLLGIWQSPTAWLPVGYSYPGLRTWKLLPTHLTLEDRLASIRQMTLEVGDHYLLRVRNISSTAY